MPWQTRTLQQIVTDAQRAFTANLPGADAALARNNLSPVAKIIAGFAFDIERFAAWAADQRFVATCDADQLDRHGAEMKPAVPRKDASAATGLVTVNGTGAVSLSTGAILVRSDGAAFSVDAGLVLAGAGSGTVPVTALIPGATGATEAGAVLSASSGLIGPATFAVAASGLGGAADAEEDPAYRARLLFAKAFPEHAGAPPDWLRYTLAVPGVTRAYIDPLGFGRASVVVYPFFDASRPNGIPLESDRAAVEEALRISGPGAALPIVRIAQAIPIDIIIQNLSPDTPETRAAVAAELASSFFANSRVAGQSPPHRSMPFLATAARFSRSWIWQAVANATGEQSHEITSPATDTLLTPGQTAVPGSISFA